VAKIELPEGWAGVAEPLRALMAEVDRKEHVDRATPPDLAADYGALEQRVADALGEVERGLHAQVLARLDIDVPAIRVWGDEYRRVGRSESEYHTLAGTVRVMRTVYRKTERNGDTLDPVSVRAGVIADGCLPHTAREMAHLLAQGTSREAEATGRDLARLPYSRSSLERVGHEVGALFRRARPRIEEALIQEYAVPADARSVSISIDRVALPMEEPIEASPVPVDPPWVAAVMAAAPPHPPEVQAVLDEQKQGDAPKIARNFRMAYAATVTLHDAEGDSIHTIRYGRMPKGDVRGLCRGLARDVAAMRSQRPELKGGVPDRRRQRVRDAVRAAPQDAARSGRRVARGLLARGRVPRRRGAGVRGQAQGEAGAVPALAARLEARRRRRGGDRGADGAERPREGHARWRAPGRGGDPLLPHAAGAHGVRRSARGGAADRQRQRRGDVQEPGLGSHEAARCPVEARDRR
jgi:hypothetical protein